LLEWSHSNRERISSFVRREISEQLKVVGGVASQEELDALKKRVRDLERAAGMTASGRKRAKATAAKKRTSTTRVKTAASPSKPSGPGSGDLPGTGGSPASGG
jgi:hypothetical protein